MWRTTASSGFARETASGGSEGRAGAEGEEFGPQQVVPLLLPLPLRHEPEGWPAAQPAGIQGSGERSTRQPAAAGRKPVPRPPAAAATGMASGRPSAAGRRGASAAPVSRAAKVQPAPMHAAAAAAAAPSTAQNRPPGSARLKQAAAKMRADKLRRGLQQLRAMRGPPAPTQGSASNAKQDPSRTEAPQAPATAPAVRRRSPEVQHPAPAMVPTPVASGAAAEVDSDPEDLFDDISLGLLARLRLGGAPVAAMAGEGARQPEDVGCTARKALREAAADAEMSPPGWQLGAGQDHCCCLLQLQQQQQPSAQDLVQLPVSPRGATGNLQTATAAMQERLEQLRCALRSPEPAGLPPSASQSLNRAAQPGQERTCWHLSSANVAAAGPGPAATAAAAEPRRQRLAAGELVVTRAPSRPAIAQSLASKGAERAMPERLHAAQPPSSSACSDSGGGSPSARLAALLTQRHQAHMQPTLHPAAHGSSWPAPAAASRSMSLEHHCGAAAVEATSQAAGLAHPSASQPPNWLTAQASRGAAAGAMPPTPARGLILAPATSKAAAGVAAEGDILEAWRRRRQAQPGQLADKYSRYLSLQPQPQQHRAPPASERAALWQPEAAQLRSASAGSTCELAVVPPQSFAAPLAAAATGTRSSAGQADGSGGDILERWRARRRQQAVSRGAATDYSSLLTLRVPSSSPALARPPLPASSPSRSSASATLASLQQMGVPPAGQQQPSGMARECLTPRLDSIPPTSASQGSPQHMQAGYRPEQPVCPPCASQEPTGSSRASGPAAAAVAAPIPALPGMALQCAAAAATEKCRPQVALHEPSDPSRPGAQLHAAQPGAAAEAAQAGTSNVEKDMPQAEQDTALAEADASVAASSECKPKQPSRPPSAASSGWATPRSGTAVGR